MHNLPLALYYCNSFFFSLRHLEQVTHFDMKPVLIGLTTEHSISEVIVNTYMLAVLTALGLSNVTQYIPLLHRRDSFSLIGAGCSRCMIFQQLRHSLYCLWSLRSCFFIQLDHSLLPHLGHGFVIILTSFVLSHIVQ